MPTGYRSRKQYGKQKTYGKSVKTHLSGWFGRNLWTELESTTDANSTSTQGESQQSRRKATHEKETPTASKDTGTNKSTVVKAVTEEPSGQDIDSVVRSLDNLGISDEAPFSVPIGRRASAVVSELSTGSSASSVRESSDKENEANSAYNTAASTPRVPIGFAQTPPPDLTPRSILGERDSVKESPPRKRGLRKRVSAVSAKSPGTGVSSPLKHEFSGKKNEASEVEDPILVWEDDMQDTVGEELFTSVIDKRAPTPKSNTEIEQQEPHQTTTPEMPQSDRHVRLEAEGSPAPVIRSRSKLSPDMSRTSKSVTEPPVEDPDGSDFSELPKISRFSETSEPIEISIPPETAQLLRLCTEEKIVDFATHIEMMLRGSTIRKLGEASYSEVFLKSESDSESTTVLKVIPFGKEEQCEVKSIVQEVRITKAMAGIDGFIGFRGAYVAQGYFPEALMGEWDAFDDERGSENERPDFYEEDQLFAIIMLENGGTDLEHTELAGWEEAADVFWQVVFALARGEKEREFEHRDLHFGNIVIRRKQSSKKASSDSPETLLENLSLEDRDPAEKVSNLKVALIDYTLSRAYCGDLSGQFDVEFMPLNDPALFCGKGDYQFDIYRFMRNHLSSGLVQLEEEYIDWNVYTPRTNVFWLHYLTNVLLTKMRIPRPAARGRNASSEVEKECFKQLETVGKAIDPRKKRFGTAVMVESAQQLVAWVVEEGIIASGI